MQSQDIIMMDETSSSSSLCSTEYVSSPSSSVKPIITKTKSNKRKSVLVSYQWLSFYMIGSRIIKLWRELSVFLANE